jgi:hypothetical protein
MKTKLFFMQKPTPYRLMFRISETRPAAVVEPPSLPARNNLIRYFAGLMLVGTAVGAHVAGSRQPAFGGSPSARRLRQGELRFARSAHHPR